MLKLKNTKINNTKKRSVCISTKSKINHWTNEQVALLKQIYPYYSNSELSVILKHPANSVSDKAIQLGLKKQKWWTDKELNVLKKYYPLLGAERIKDAFLPHRTTGSIKKKAHELGIRLNYNVAFKVWNDNLKGRLNSSLIDHHEFKNCKDLRDAARNRILKWRKEVLEYYNNTCVLTGKSSDVVVHHIRPFAEIFYSTLCHYENTYHFKRNDNLKRCIELNGCELVDDFLNDVYNNHTIRHGVVITRFLHDLFHNRYGTYYFTEADFYQFVQDYNNGLYRTKREVVTS